jgi:hypothetical protein
MIGSFTTAHNDYLDPDRYYEMEEASNMECYQVMWDNGRNASGIFDDIFLTKAEAFNFGREWVAEMETFTPTPEGEEGYSFEVVNESGDIVEEDKQIESILD